MLPTILRKRDKPRHLTAPFLRRSKEKREKAQISQSEIPLSVPPWWSGLEWCALEIEADRFGGSRETSKAHRHKPNKRISLVLSATDYEPIRPSGHNNCHEMMSTGKTHQEALIERHNKFPSYRHNLRWLEILIGHCANKQWQQNSRDSTVDL